MSEDLKGQVSGSAADVYEAFFVPALFGQWAGRMADALGIAPGDAVLDVACGTGVLAREAARRALPGGMVTGLDRNPAMLAVARHLAPAIDWQEGRAEALPFPDAQYHCAGCQFGLMFFDDRAAALREMARVLRPGGRLGVAVWDSLDATPGYADMVALLQRLFGERVANELRAPFALGDPARLAALATEADLAEPEVLFQAGTARFPSIEDWVRTDVKGWTLADMIDEEQYARLLREAGPALAHHAQPDGSVAFASPAIILTATKR